MKKGLDQGFLTCGEVSWMLAVAAIWVLFTFSRENRCGREQFWSSVNLLFKLPKIIGTHLAETTKTRWPRETNPSIK